MMGSQSRADTHKGSSSAPRSAIGAAVATAWLAIACSGVSAPSTDEAVATQEQALHTLVGATWVAQGPAPMINGQAFTFPLSNQNPVTGAIHAVAPHPTDSNILYVGSVNGGVWRTNDALDLRPIWTPLTDTQPSLNMGAIALDRTNPQVVIAGTGRWSSLGNDGGSQGEVLISRDGGATWTVSSDPLFAGQKLSGVVIRGNTVLASAIDAAGLVRSTNGGVSWTQVSGAAGSGLPFGAIDDLIEDRQNANRLYTTISGIGVFRSDNLGATWVNVSQNDPGEGRLDTVIRNFSNGARMSTSNDGRAYIGIVSADDLLLVEYTTNGGASWVAMDRPGVGARGNPFFHMAIGADPNNSNFVYVAGVTDWKRGDASVAPTGGFPSPQWADIANGGTPNFTSPHADERDIGFTAGGDLVLASDGGIFRRPRPRLSSDDWVSMAGNLQTGEVHDVAYDSNSRIAFGGTQDNGTIFQTTPGSLAWDLFFGGDGGDVQVDTLSNPGFSIRYSSFQNLGAFNRATYDANNVQVSQTFIGLLGGAIQPTFVTPVELNRASPIRLVLGGGDAVYESFNQGDNITSLGEGAGARSMFYGHPLNPDVLYVVRDVIFTRLAANAPLAPTPTPIPIFDARDVVLDPSNFRRAYFAGGSQGVFLTPDAGNTWSNITGNLTTFNTGDVRTIEFIPGTPHGLVVVGTNRGVFATATDALGTWQEVGNLPNAPVDDMQYSRRGDLLFVSQLGRGAWSVTGLGGPSQPPVARCQDVAVEAGPSCTATVTSAAVNNGTTDPDGDPFTCVLSPTGPFNVGKTAVTLVCTDVTGASGTCTASISVSPGDRSACCPAGTNVIVGTSGNNVINGTAGRDCILGLGGQDTINGLGGDDIISGGDGTDTLSGGVGNDLIFGGLGQDTLNGNAGDDALSGGDGDDQCFGGDGNDSLFGGDGQDRLFGDAGNDKLIGNTGDDRLEGGDGNDLLDGSGLHDVCIGGPGTDTFLICEDQTQ